MAEEKFRVLSYEAALTSAQEDASYLVSAVGTVPPQLQAGTVKRELMIALQRMALEEEKSLAPGDFLSRLMRLPPVWRNVALEYIGGGGPYSGGKPKLRVTLLNASRVQVRYLRGSTALPIPDRFSGAPTDRQAIVKHFRNLAPGETVTLDSDMAVAALVTHGLYAQPVFTWAQRMPRIDEETQDPTAPNGKKIITDRPLVEVGYEMEWFSGDGNEGMANSAEWQRDKVAEIVARAEKAASQSDALSILSEVKSWWPKSDAYTSILTRSGGEAVDSEPSRRRRVA